MKLGNKAIASFNLAFSYLKKAKTEGMFRFLRELEELESLVTPEMKVYGNFIKSGFDSLMFSKSPQFLQKIQSIEDLISLTFESETQRKDRFIDPFEFNEELKNNEEQQDKIRATYLRVRKELEQALKRGGTNSKEGTSIAQSAVKVDDSIPKNRFSKSSIVKNTIVKKRSFESKLDEPSSVLSSIPKDFEVQSNRVVVLYPVTGPSDKKASLFKNYQPQEGKNRLKKVNLSEKLRSMTPSKNVPELQNNPSKRTVQTKSNRKRGSPRRPVLSIDLASTPGYKEQKEQSIDLFSPAKVGFFSTKKQPNIRSDFKTSSFLTVENTFESKVVLSKEMEVFLSGLYIEFFSILETEPENIAIIFYLTVLSYFVKTRAHFDDFLSLFSANYSLNYKGRGCGLMDLYHSRMKNLKQRGQEIKIMDNEYE